MTRVRLRPGDRERESGVESGLGSDPFSGADGTLPYLIRLRERSLHLVSPEIEDPPERAVRPAPAERREPIDLGPPVPEVALDDTDEGSSWIDRVCGLALDREDEQRLQTVAQSYGQVPYDTLGLNTRTVRRALAFFKLLYRHYFRVESRGHEVLPEKQGAILAANHGGLLPFDGAMTVVDVFSKASPPRIVRSIVERWAGTLPFVNVFYARVGQVIGTRDNFRDLLRRDQLVLVFPEGVEGIRKRAAERYMLREFHLGFVEESLRHRVPIAYAQSRRGNAARDRRAGEAPLAGSPQDAVALMIKILEWFLRWAGFLEVTDHIVLVRSWRPSLELVDGPGVCVSQRCVAWPVLLVDARGGRMGGTPLLRGSDD